MTGKQVSMNMDPVPGKSVAYSLAHSEIDPVLRHAVVANNAGGTFFGGNRAEVPDCAAVFADKMGATGDEKVAMASRTLTAQAMTLDVLFAQLAQKAQSNMNEYPLAAERYLRLALKAQSQSRTTLTALVDLHQPREQTVRHIHVGPDGQAVFIENLHGGFGNARSVGQPHAQGAPGAALLGHDAGGNGVPVSGGEGEAALPDARRGKGKRRTDREQACVEARGAVGEC